MALRDAEGTDPKAWLVGLALLSLLTMSASSSPAQKITAKTLNLGQVELADEPHEIRRGLMFRREMCDSCGMLFAFPRPRVASFWMKNTYLPLDMIFMKADGRIVAIHRDTMPLRAFPTYSSGTVITYVLEVNAGYARREGLETGQRIDLEALREHAVEYRWSKNDKVSPSYDGVSP